MKTCITCGMPFEGAHANDIGLELPEGPVCKYDSENDAVKSGTAIFEGGVTYFTDAVTEGDRALAERLTRTNMKMLPYWQERPFPELEGAEASPEEFRTAMAKLSA